MAGLRHNPAAPYCTKRTELGDDAPALQADARCPYCDAKGVGPTTDGADVGAELAQELAGRRFGDLGGEVNISGGATAEDVTAAIQRQRAHIPPTESPVVSFFKHLGLQKGGIVTNIRTVDGSHWNGRHIITEVRSLEGRDIVLTVQPEGTAVEYRIRWAHIVSFQSQTPTG
jgi:hypothetical protein